MGRGIIRPFRARGELVARSRRAAAVTPALHPPSSKPMAVRLQMKLGVVAESERLEDSPDTVAVVEPTIGATSRTKGSLYVVVAGIGRARRLQEATRLVADTVQGEYYYDESAGLIACLDKAIRTANRKLLAQRDRLGLGNAASGPLGIGVAVVRGAELYVATAGPVQALLVHQARLLALPDPNADRGLPAEELAPKIWRGDVIAGDTLALVSRPMIETVGPEVLKDAVLTLHPQAALEQVHRAFVAAGGRGSDGALVMEAAEVAATSQRGRLVPARPPEPLAGTPDRSPIPLADTVGEGVAAVSSGAQRARTAAGSAAGGLLARLQDLMPRRGPHYRRVTPAATRRESQRRAAVAVLAFVGIASVLGISLWVVGGSGGGSIDQVTAGEAALVAAKDDLRVVFGNGANLVADDPKGAEERLLHAYEQLDLAATHGVPAATLRPLRAQATGGLDDIYGVVDVAPRTAFSFADQEKPFALVDLVIGPDGAPYVLDATTKTVYRVDLRTKKASPMIRNGTSAAGIKVGVPHHLAVGGLDVLALDAKNVLWRWRPANTKGKGTLARVRVAESSTWGADILGIGTFLRDPDAGLYNLYVIDPSEQQILRYSPAQDGSGFPAKGSGYLTTPQDVSAITSMFIDGDVYTADAGIVTRFAGGKSSNWAPDAPPDKLLRPAPAYTLIASPDAAAREGVMYGYDPGSDRIVAFDKATGAYQAQYRIANGGLDWADVRGFAVVPRAAGQAPIAYWIERDRLGTAVLQDVSALPTPSASPSSSPGESPATSPKATKKPKATPKP